MRTTIIIACLLLAGCTPQTESDFRSVIACELALGSMQTNEPTPDVTENCDGSGWITQGDGHKTKCPGCPACEGNSGEYGSFMGISDATKAVKTTCEKVDAVIDKLLDGGLNINVGDEAPLPTWAPDKPACPDGQCSTQQTLEVPVTAEVKARPATVQRRRLFRRWRR